MKKYLLTIMAVVVASLTMAQTIDTSKLSEYDQNAPVGFGAEITGGSDENPVTVETLSELSNAMSGSTKRTIYVKGTIEFSGLKEYRNISNKTIIGLEGAVFSNTNHIEQSSSDFSKDKTGILLLRSCKNIIIRNITFKGAGAYDVDGNDNLWLYGSTNVWIDHCDFQDGVDGNFDCTEGSDNICVTWCRFRYLITPWSGGSGGANDHRYSNLWGGSDSKTSDQGKLRTTFTNCWWGDGCRERMPRIRFGQVHLLICLYSSSVANYCVGGGYRSNAYIEKCAFTTSKAKSNAWKNYATKSGYTDYNVTITDCSGVSDKQARSGSIDYFVPSDKYSYTAYDASQVESVVSNADNGAGATIKFTTSGIQDIKSSAAVIRTEYYTLDGQRLASPGKGINIQVVTRADNSQETRKLILP